MHEPLLEKRPLDPSYQSGPIEQRPFRDLFFLIAFILYLAFMTYIGILGLIEGHPDLLLTPFDSSGHQCKYDKADTDYSNYPYIAISNQSGQWIATCVKGCTLDQQSECKLNNITTQCVPYEAWEIGRICVPQEDTDNARDFYQKIGLTKFIEFFQDIKTAWPVVGASIGISFLLSLIYVVLLQQCIACVVWGTIGVFLLMSLGFGLLCLILPHSEALKDMIHFHSLPLNLQTLNVLQGMAITFLCLFAIFLLMTCCLYKRIKTAISIMKAAGDFIRSNYFIYIVPVVTLIISAFTLMVWLTVMLFLASCGDIIPPEQGSYVPFGWVDWSNTTRYLMIVQVIGLIWILMFIGGCEKYLVSSSVAIWYYEEGYPDKPILRSLPRLLKSTGSVALGSFLISVTIVIRLLLSFANYLYNRTGIKETENSVGKCCLRACECLANCFEKLVSFITDKAYIMMAISGKSFCVSAAQSMGITISCLGQTAVLSTTTKAFCLIGKVLITGSSTIICLIMITSIRSISFALFSTLGPVLAFVLLSYSVSSLMIEYYRMVAETLLMCYCIEKQFSGARGKCPGHMRNYLQDYVDESAIE